MSLKGKCIISVTVFFALILLVIPLPQIVTDLRPQWIALVLLYWAIAAPRYMGLFYVAIVGLFVDVLTGTLLGQHALTLAVVCYIANKLNSQFPFYPLLHQALVIMVLLFLYQFLLYWPQALIGQAVNSWQYWLTPLVGMLLWPWICALLRGIGRHYRIE